MSGSAGSGLKLLLTRQETQETRDKQRTLKSAIYGLDSGHAKKGLYQTSKMSKEHIDNQSEEGRL